MRCKTTKPTDPLHEPPPALDNQQIAEQENRIENEINNQLNQLTCTGGKIKINDVCQCTNGQAENAQGVCATPAPPPKPCPAGKMKDYQGNCVWAPCPSGQTRNSAGQCVNRQPICWARWVDKPGGATKRVCI